MLEVLAALTVLISAENAASIALAETESENRVEIHVDTATQRRAELRAQRIARMRAKMRSSQPRVSTVRCAHAACDAVCKTANTTVANRVAGARLDTSTASNRAAAAPSSCEHLRT